VFRRVGTGTSCLCRAVTTCSLCIGLSSRVPYVMGCHHVFLVCRPVITCSGILSRIFLVCSLSITSSSCPVLWLRVPYDFLICRPVATFSKNTDLSSRAPLILVDSHFHMCSHVITSSLFIGLSSRVSYDVQACHQETRSVLQNVPTEECGLEPKENCKMETVMVPKWVRMAQHM
jgi:hypothetical protein